MPATYPARVLNQWHTDRSYAYLGNAVKRARSLPYQKVMIVAEGQLDNPVTLNSEDEEYGVRAITFSEPPYRIRLEDARRRVKRLFVDVTEYEVVYYD